VPRRQQHLRPVKTRVLVVGEGKETEPDYLNGLKREDAVRRRFVIKVSKGRGKSPEETVKRAIDRQERATNREEDYDEVWCLVDVEEATTERRDSLGRAVTTARQNNITLCLSNPSFEVWLLSHFEKKGRSYKNGDAVIVELNKHWQKHCRQDYRKNDERVYDRVADRTPIAISNAKWVRKNHHRDRADTVDANSSTEVYRLVEHLIEQD